MIFEMKQSDILKFIFCNAAVEQSKDTSECHTGNIQTSIVVKISTICVHFTFSAAAVPAWILEIQQILLDHQKIIAIFSHIFLDSTTEMFCKKTLVCLGLCLFLSVVSCLEQGKINNGSILLIGDSLIFKVIINHFVSPQCWV